MELCLLVEPSIVCFPRLCGISKFECEHSEDLGAELVDFAQRYLDLMRALAVQYGTVMIERQQPRTKIGKESDALLVHLLFFPIHILEPPPKRIIYLCIMAASLR